MVLIDLYKVPIGVALGVVAGMLSAAMVLSLLIPPRVVSEPGTPGAGPPSSESGA
jgi:hypothetical protein